ncbi:hypothetical protein [Amycolatopsis thermophila]|uniref:Uncharacterized protein n=1 Tax=Amycolatopsis thermophila TaxID=206084 RepID=A0ABU0F4B0_9PSEU|nr:hypothetical protein [Amycolatopsis thermophila]MDQ0381996.1 hypothetical protein [Amycolatopsis thermophila]
MDLTSWLLRRTPVRPLIAATPGGAGARLAAEREARIRGWRLALSPAEATMLIVAGPQDESMAAAVETVWRQMPFPRSRAEFAEAADVVTALAEAEARLRSAEHQRREAARGGDAQHGSHHQDASGSPEHAHHGSGEAGGGQSAPPSHHEHMYAPPEDHDRGHRPHDEHAHHDHDSEDMREQHDHHADEHPGDHTALEHDHGGHMQHGGHAGHDMGGMEMPGDIPMADRAPDRDGLQLDRLTVQLGPILPAWPDGLVVRVALQGDVIQEAAVETNGSQDVAEPFWQSLEDGVPRDAARRLDSCYRLLTVAGWEQAADTAARMRDLVLAGERISAEFHRWARRVRRSRILRWSLSGLGEIDWVDSPATGDALDRLTRWIDDAEAELGSGEPVPDEDPARILEALPELLIGTEFAGARLIVASLDPDLERARVAHG